jgi:hypothetical protein
MEKLSPSIWRRYFWSKDRKLSTETWNQRCTLVVNVRNCQDNAPTVSVNGRSYSRMFAEVLARGKILSAGTVPGEVSPQRVAFFNISFGRSCKTCGRPIRRLEVCAQPSEEYSSTAYQSDLELARTATKSTRARLSSVKEMLVRNLI